MTDAIAANARRCIKKMSELQGKEYCLVGDGAYAKELLIQLTQQQISLPTVWWVSSIQVDYPHIVQYIENQQSVIEQQTVVLGTGHFQLEMLHRLQSKCAPESKFWDLMLCAPENVPASAGQQTQNYLIYVDMYAKINKDAYLRHFFTALETTGTEVRLHHPLEVLSDQYISSAKSVLVWNGSTSAFLPLMQRFEDLKVDITYAECGFFPQHQHFYFDKRGVNNHSQLDSDNLTWVDEKMLVAIAWLRQQQLASIENTECSSQSYIFVPLQVPTDSNVLNHSEFIHGMQGFIDYIEAKYKQQQVVFKPHPKDRLSDTYRYSHGKVSSSDTQQLCAHATLVHGINSSVLYEAALLGVPVRVEGDCLLKRHIKQIDKLLAAIYYRQFNVVDKSFNAVKLKQFSFLAPELFAPKILTCAELPAAKKFYSLESENAE